MSTFNQLRWLSGDFVVCQAPDFSEVSQSESFLFLAKTDEEYSIVCSAEAVPANATAIETGWRALRIEGQIEFSMIGVIARISEALARQGIGLFVISTFNTDYVLVKAVDQDLTIQALMQAGYQFIN